MTHTTVERKLRVLCALGQLQYLLDVLQYTRQSMQEGLAGYTVQENA
jgi:hypothetical protein